jgi:hypothetical protein
MSKEGCNGGHGLSAAIKLGGLEKTVGPSLIALMAADKPCPQLQPSLLMSRSHRSYALKLEISKSSVPATMHSPAGLFWQDALALLFPFFYLP